MDRSVQASTLIGAVWPRDQRGEWTRAAVLALAGAVLLTISAKLKVPFYPVPMTMQSFMVLAIGVAYGARLGAATVLFYLAAGAAGLPVFADTPEKGLGLAYMVGPTGGYLVGFVVAAAIAGMLAERGWDRGFWKLLAVMLLGHVALFVLGVAWLAHYVEFARAWTLGVEPFYLATALKCLLGAGCVRLAWRYPGLS